MAALLPPGWAVISTSAAGEGRRGACYRRPGRQALHQGFVAQVDRLAVSQRQVPRRVFQRQPGTVVGVDVAMTGWDSHAVGFIVRPWAGKQQDKVRRASRCPGSARTVLASRRGRHSTTPRFSVGPPAPRSPFQPRGRAWKIFYQAEHKGLQFRSRQGGYGTFLPGDLRTRSATLHWG